MNHTCRTAATILNRSPSLIRWLCRRYSIGVLVTPTRRELSPEDVADLAERVANPKSRIRSARSPSGQFVRQPGQDLSAAIVSLREAARRYRDEKGTLAAALAIVRGEWA